jgi:hypothetical protein
MRHGHGVVATVTLDLYTNIRESFKSPVSHRVITHFDEYAIGLGVWILHLELDHVLVSRDFSRLAPPSVLGLKPK